VCKTISIITLVRTIKIEAPKIILTAFVDWLISILEVVNSAIEQNRMSIQILLKTLMGTMAKSGTIKQCIKHNVAPERPNTSYGFVILYFIFIPLLLQLCCKYINILINATLLQ
jgi:hypothetical protein